MGSYDIVFRKSALKDLRNLPKLDVAMLLDAIDSLCDNPRPPQSGKLSDQERYRLRKGKYRILYEIENTHLIITVVKIVHRKDAYR